MSYYQNELVTHALMFSRNLYNSFTREQKKLFKAELNKNGIDKIILVEIKRKYSLKL